MSDLYLLEEFIREALLDEARKKKRKSRKKKRKSRKKKKTSYPSQYKAKGKRKKKLDRATKLAKSSSKADRQKAYKMRDNMERLSARKKDTKTFQDMIARNKEYQNG